MRGKRKGEGRRRIVRLSTNMRRRGRRGRVKKRNSLRGGRIEE
jgi:hypothetical protein